jgi:hypothetical protein
MTEQDTGDLLDVPQSEQMKEDDAPEDERNEDEGRTDFSGEPVGSDVDLSTASLDEED